MPFEISDNRVIFGPIKELHSRTSGSGQNCQPLSLSSTAVVVPQQLFFHDRDPFTDQSWTPLLVRLSLKVPLAYLNLAFRCSLQ